MIESVFKFISELIRRINVTQILSERGFKRGSSDHEADSLPLDHNAFLLVSSLEPKNIKLYFYKQEVDIFSFLVAMCHKLQGNLTSASNFFCFKKIAGQTFPFFRKK